MSYVSTGGGAFLEFLDGTVLPAVVPTLTPLTAASRPPSPATVLNSKPSASRKLTFLPPEFAWAANSVTSLPANVAERVFGRVKFLARLKTYQDSLPQDGRIDAAEVGARNDLRVSTYPTVTGEKIVLRVFQSATVPMLSGLEFHDAAVAELEKLLRRSAGLLLLTGGALP